MRHLQKIYSRIMAKKLLVFPTWTLFHFLRRFLPQDHKWKNKQFTLDEWAKGSTDLNDAFSLFFWVMGLGLSFMLFILHQLFKHFFNN